MVVDPNRLKAVDNAYSAAEKLVDEISSIAGKARPLSSVVAMIGRDGEADTSEQFAADYLSALKQRKELWISASNLRPSERLQATGTDGTTRNLAPIVAPTFGNACQKDVKPWQETSHRDSDRKRVG